MKVRVLLFAGARQMVGKEQLVFELSDAPTIGELRREMMHSHGELQDLIARALFALDAEYADDTDLIAPQSEVACIPPVSGG